MPFSPVLRSTQSRFLSEIVWFKNVKISRNSALRSVFKFSYRTTCSGFLLRSQHWLNRRYLFTDWDTKFVKSEKNKSIVYEDKKIINNFFTKHFALETKNYLLLYFTII